MLDGFVQPMWTEREFCYLSQLAFGEYARRTGRHLDVAQELSIRYKLTLDELDALAQKFSTGLKAVVDRRTAAA